MKPAFHCESKRKNPFEIEPWYLVKRSVSNGGRGFARSVPAGTGVVASILIGELLSNAKIARIWAHGCRDDARCNIKRDSLSQFV